MMNDAIANRQPTMRGFMHSDLQANINTLLAKTNIGFLSSHGEHYPETSMVPFACFENNILLHLSQLARHSKNIQRQAQTGLMICTPESAGESVLSLPRLSLHGSITSLKQGQQTAAQAIYLQRIPDAAPLFNFADFHLYTLEIESVYWVGGFGAAREISLQDWQNMVFT